jgi:hypothetical protein
MARRGLISRVNTLHPAMYEQRWHLEPTVRSPNLVLRPENFRWRVLYIEDFEGTLRSDSEDEVWDRLRLRLTVRFDPTQIDMINAGHC